MNKWDLFLEFKSGSIYKDKSINNVIYHIIKINHRNIYTSQFILKISYKIQYHDLKISNNNRH